MWCAHSGIVFTHDEGKGNQTCRRVDRAGRGCIKWVTWAGRTGTHGSSLCTGSMCVRDMSGWEGREGDRASERRKSEEEVWGKCVNQVTEHKT